MSNRTIVVGPVGRSIRVPNTPAAVRGPPGAFAELTDGRDGECTIVEGITEQMMLNEFRVYIISFDDACSPTTLRKHAGSLRFVTAHQNPSFSSLQKDEQRTDEHHVLLAPLPRATAATCHMPPDDMELEMRIGNGGDRMQYLLPSPYSFIQPFNERIILSEAPRGYICCVAIRFRLEEPLSSGQLLDPPPACPRLQATSAPLESSAWMDTVQVQIFQKGQPRVLSVNFRFLDREDRITKQNVRPDTVQPRLFDVAGVDFSGKTETRGEGKATLAKHAYVVRLRPLVQIVPW